MAVAPNMLAMLLLLAMAALVLAAVIVALVGVNRRAFGVGTSAAMTWQTEVTALANELERSIGGLQEPIDPDGLQRTVLPMAGQFRRMAREAPPTVDDQLVNRVYNLGIACQQLGAERAANRLLLDEEPIEDVVAELLDRARWVADEATDDQREPAP